MTTRAPNTAFISLDEWKMIVCALALSPRESEIALLILQGSWHQCSFVDYWDYPNGPENESTCWDSWGWDYWAVAYNYYWEYCRSQAGHEFFGYNFQSCQEEPTRGTFLCTWEDLGLCP